MKVTKNKLNNQGFGHFEALAALVVILVVAVVGVHVILSSHAATPPPASTISNGTVTPNPNISCSYRTNTFGGNGYTITTLSSENGNPASFSVKMNADVGNTAVEGYPSAQCLMYSAIPTNEASAYNITPPVI